MRDYEKRCGKCGRDSMESTGKHWVDGREPPCDVEEYSEWVCVTPGCGWRVGRKPDMGRTRDPLWNEPIKTIPRPN